jgi:hypothetical protein
MMKEVAKIPGGVGINKQGVGKNKLTRGKQVNSHY